MLSTKSKEYNTIMLPLFLSNFINTLINNHLAVSRSLGFTLIFQNMILFFTHRFIKRRPDIVIVEVKSSAASYIRLQFNFYAKITKDVGKNRYILIIIYSHHLINMSLSMTRVILLYLLNNKNIYEPFFFNEENINFRLQN